MEKKVVNLELSGAVLDDFQQVKEIYTDKQQFGNMSDEDFLKMLISLEHFRLFQQ